MCFLEHYSHNYDGLFIGVLSSLSPNNLSGIFIFSYPFSCCMLFRTDERVRGQHSKFKDNWIYWLILPEGISNVKNKQFLQFVFIQKYPKHIYSWHQHGKVNARRYHKCSPCILFFPPSFFLYTSETLRYNIWDDQVTSPSLLPYLLDPEEYAHIGNMALHLRSPKDCTICTVIHTQ